MASLRQIRRRMKSIDSIHEITKAMGMIAAFRFKRAENRWSRSKNYLVEMEKIVADLAASVDEGAAFPSPKPDAETAGAQTAPQQDIFRLFEKRQIKKKALVVMTGDKGLCGAYNTNLIRTANQWMNDNRAFQTFLVPVAKVGHEFFKKKQLPVLRAYPEKSMADLSLAKKITEELKDIFLKNEADSVEILYTAYRPGGVGQNRILPFLGLNYLTESNDKKKNPVEFIFEPDFNSVFLALLSRYLEGKMYSMLLESLTSETSARMIAMKQATENAEEVLDNLKLLRNKTRQATITRELSEIVSGASVLV